MFGSYRRDSCLLNKKCGTKMTEAKWAAQFSDDMEVRNNVVQHCGVVVQHDDKELTGGIQNLYRSTRGGGGLEQATVGAPKFGTTKMCHILPC